MEYGKNRKNQKRYLTGIIMKYLFFVLAIVSLLAGGIILYHAKGAIHEIESFILFLIFAIFTVGYGIILHLEKLEKK